MRNLVASLLAGIIMAYAASPALAQKKEPPVLIKEVRPGFHAYSLDDDSIPFQRLKIGMWAPVVIEVQCGPDDLRGVLEIECPDDQGVGAILSSPIILAKNETQLLHSYIRLGSAGGEFDVRLIVGGRELASKSVPAQPLRIGGRLLLAIGSRVPDLQEALIGLSPQKNVESGQSKSWPRFGAHESKVANLPDQWIGYDGIDLLFLGTHNAQFITELLQDAARLRAISQWTRQGGRLVVSVDPNNQTLVSELLANGAWQPSLPIVPPRVQENIAANAVKRLFKVEEFANLQNAPFPALGSDPVKIALLRNGKDNTGWEVFAAAPDGRPLIARMPYGQGQVTLVAFDLEEGPFRVWDGRVQFLKALIARLEPTVPDARDGQGNWEGGRIESDLTTDLQRLLDTFDVPVISFGWVALFIFVYILIVGPIDYLILKKVFKRLEWTWITFPTVVIIVSVAAYFTAYAIKGNELKINKIDVVDFDLRTDPDKTLVAGVTWFAIMSPHIQNYTIGIEPTVESMWPGAAAQKPRPADVISWLGRPETDGPGAMGLDRSQSWSRRPYHYVDDVRGLVGVPIPVWTTKTLSARWQALITKSPMDADLRSHERGEIRLSGTLKNNLAIDLDDVWLFYRDRCYRLPSTGSGKSLDVSLESRQAHDIQGWTASDPPPETSNLPGFYDPTQTIKNVMFLEKIDLGRKQRDYFLRRLDQSWRLRSHGESPTEAILFARVRRLSGEANSVNSDHPLPTRLWLGELPQSGATRPRLTGSMNQDTFLRIILPVSPE